FGQFVAAALRNRSLMREDTVRATCEEDGVELEALRSVEGHQGDDTGSYLVRSIRNLVRVGDERHALQEGAQGGIGLRRPRRQVCLRVKCRGQGPFRIS